MKDYSKKGQEDDSIYFDVKAFNGQVDRVISYISKGREIVITGRIAVENYTRKDGTKVVKYVVIMNGFHLCGNKPEAGPETDTAESKVKKSKKTSA